jgi:hypothetical protein
MSHDVDLVVTRVELARIARLVDEISQSHHLADQAFVFLAGESSPNRQARDRLRQMATQWKLDAGPGPSSDFSPASSPERSIDI